MQGDQFPRGKLNADDEGALNVRIGTRDKTVIIDFGKPTAWIGMDKHTALALADNIKRRAEEL